MAITLTPEMHQRRMDQLIGLSDEDVADRRNYIGGSDANIICSGNKERIYQLYLEKVGEAEPEDLSDVLAVQMGSWTEDLNLYWFERQTGHRLSQRNIQKEHPDLPFIRARADAEIEELDAVLDAKHVSAFNYDMDKLIARYSPQLAMQMRCAGRSRAYLSVFSGSNKWEYAPLYLEQDYIQEVEYAIIAFWNAVQTKTPPHLPETKPRVPQDQMRSISMEGSNAWRNAEFIYLESLPYVEDNKQAAIDLKELVPDDVKEAVGIDLQIKRAKNGSLRISKVKK